MVQTLARGQSGLVLRVPDAEHMALFIHLNSSPYTGGSLKLCLLGPLALTLLLFLFYIILIKDNYVFWNFV